MGSIQKTPPQVVAAPCCFSIGGFQVVSDSVPEVNEDYNLVQGISLSVVAADGKVVHEGIRGFIFLNEACHLVRLSDKSWWCCDANGTPKQKSALRKKNLTLGSSAFMFDERGKLRLGQQCPQYPMLSY